MKPHAKPLLAAVALTCLVVIAGSSTAAAACSNEALRVQQGSTFLSSCRAYEKVSPAEKNANDINPFVSSGGTPGTKSSVDGNRVAFASIGAFSGSPSAAGFQIYRGARGSAGWSTISVSPPQTTSTVDFSFGQVQEFSSDLGTAVVDSFNPPLTGDALPETGNLYLRDLPSGAYSLLTRRTLTPTEPSRTRIRFAAASADFTHFVIETTDALTTDAPVGFLPKLYEANAAGDLRLVGVLPDDSLANGAIAGPGVGYTAGALNGSYTLTSMSRDGSRIFWTDAETGQLYMREDGTDTIHISASQRSDAPGTPQPARFRTATPDGDTVLFTSSQKLTEDSTAEEGSVPIEDLYAFDVESGALTNISASPTPGEAAEALGVVGVSDDGTRVYFAARGALAEGAEDDFNPKLYVWDEGEVKYLAWFEEGQMEAANWTTAPLEAEAKPSRVSADGGFLLFLSKTPPPGTEGTGGLKQLYRYDLAADEVTCVSCVASGPTGSPATIMAVEPIAPPNFAQFEPAIMATGGDRVFFNTAAPLDPSHDVNEAIDVYEWRADGTAGCENPRGCHALLSNGLGAADEASFFAAASPSGDDVFFITRQRLLPSDRDSNLDLYDARIDGGFPEPPPPPTPCAGEACLVAPAPAPPSAAVPSATLDGPGNLKPKRKKAKKKNCRRGGKAQGKAKGRCGKKGSKQKQGSKNKKRAAVRAEGEGR